MSAMPSKFSSKYSAWKCKFSFSVLTLAFCASSAWGAAPPVVVDAQQTLGTGYNEPQSIAVSRNGTVFVADSGNNRIAALTTTLPNLAIPVTVPTGGFALVNPQAVALDANGDLFVGDTPATGGRIIELVGDGKGNLTGAANLIFSGAPLANPISLAVDGTGTLFIGDFPSSGAGVIYSLASGAPAPQLLTITGLSPQLTPAALLRDSSTNLYIADNGNGKGSLGGLFIAPAAGGAAQPVPTGSFTFNQPAGLAFDATANLYVLTELGTGTGFNAGYQVVVIPAASPTTPYILPNSGIGNPSGLSFDPQGNLDLTDTASGSAIQLAYVSPVNMGTIAVGQASTQAVLFNFEFNAPTNLGGFRVVAQGDVTNDLLQKAGGSCKNGAHNNLPGGGPTISPYFPYTCNESYVGAPTFPGLRSSAIQAKGTGNTILASTSVYETGAAGVQITYPLNVNTTAINLQEPEALAISGADKLVYVADFGAGAIYVAAGLDGAGLTKVSTGAIATPAPSALALDGAGNLFIADYNLGELIEVPKNGQATFVVNTGGLLQHPIALAFDQRGNLYIGDSGPEGQGATGNSPGYLVKMPAGGAAFKMTIPSVHVIFPQALAANPVSSALWIGDGGDLSGVGQVVQVSADGSTASIEPIDGVTNPSGLVFDQAQDVYVLDGTANTVTVVPPTTSGVAPHLLEFVNTTLVGASAIANSAGGQGFVIASVGQGTVNNLLHVNGNSSTLKFGNVNFGSSGQQTAMEYNIGNAPFTLPSPFYTVTQPNAAYTILGSSSCADGQPVNPSGSCTINVQFTPKFIGFSTGKIVVDSSAYNSGVPTISFQGTGKNAGTGTPASKSK
jgi:sugar lactone lactonase YvrE